MKRLFGFLCGASLWLSAVGSTEASFQNFFPALRAEVANRIATLSGIHTLTPTQKAQLKALGSALKAIDKSSTSLEADLKHLASVAGALNESFGADVTFSNLLRTCIGDYAAYCQTRLDALNTQINALPAGSRKNAANTARLAAQAIVTQAGSGSPFVGEGTLGGFHEALCRVQKAINKAEKKGVGPLIPGGSAGDVATYTLFTYTGTLVNRTLNLNTLPLLTTPSGTNDNSVASSGAGAE